MIRRFWRWLSAVYRWDPAAVCELSRGRGLADYHDYPDSTTPEPCHFTTHTCARCGKLFTI